MTVLLLVSGKEELKYVETITTMIGLEAMQKKMLVWPVDDIVQVIENHQAVLAFEKEELVGFFAYWTSGRAGLSSRFHWGFSKLSETTS